MMVYTAWDLLEVVFMAVDAVTRLVAPWYKSWRASLALGTFISWLPWTNTIPWKEGKGYEGIPPNFALHVLTCSFSLIGREGRSTP